MQLSFKTIAKESEGFYKEKGSKFLAFAFPVNSEEDVKNCQERLRKEYYDARHHCYAYVLGEDYSLFRANDDGEPNHSAGDPILGQIRSKELTNTLVVVVRYFGGTKLGVGGLINAYKVATEAALNNNKLIAVSITNTYAITFDYATTNEVMRLVQEYDLKIIEQKFEVDCYLKVDVTVGVEDQFLNKIQLLKELGNALKYVKINP